MPRPASAALHSPVACLRAKDRAGALNRDTRVGAPSPSAWWRLSMQRLRLVVACFDRLSMTDRGVTGRVWRVGAWPAEV
ncbi:MAG: hypothetical protein AMXMBFR61_23850 [Fimbriimonadales bacterium]